MQPQTRQILWTVGILGGVGAVWWWCLRDEFTPNPKTKWSPAERRKRRRRLMKEIESDETRRYKERIDQLKQDEQDARDERDRRLAELRDDVQLRRQMTTEEYAEARQQIRDEANEKIRAAIDARKEARAFRGEMRRIGKTARGMQRERKKRTRATWAEKRRESDDEVRGNIDPELLPLWEDVKRSIKGTSRLTRTEQFLLYAEEHPFEVIEAQERTMPSDAQYEKEQRQAYDDWFEDKDEDEDDGVPF